MNILDNLKIYKQLDEQDLYGSLTKLGRQIESGWTSAEFVSLNFDPEKIRNIVFAGMGGSNLAAHTALALSPLLLRVPFEIVANYRLPSYSDKNTLVILSSYSGNTEEILSCAQDATMRGCPSVVITTGGQLQTTVNKNKLPLILLDQKFNPSHTPRAGIGLSLGAVLGLLIRLNPSSQKYFDLKEIIRTVERVFDMVNIHKETSENPAKSLAAKHKGSGIILFSANHLTGVGKTIANYLNESAKTMSHSFVFPDLNHHLLEGFTFPAGLRDQTNIIILNSSLYPEVIQKRIHITKDILTQQKYKVTILNPETTDITNQVFESLVFLIMFSYYLSISNKVDPITNPWVDYLKNKIH
ncbi:MAG: Bifunctional phosphoglucose/phosphomannose isomerase [Candidatus Collierbacteria bacterium GW2011_GWC2_43_12]|uniref:Bifunctional phosphoglucose/phosphomannose isomerase n=1 Tax=Candidatus Collierbacteria bacterium GW2011_GWC2_43_12 TaxID=1618390 RepID=A0A0G1D4U7_9BACT|nr:MAG: Bifunctional phosphoglucose/phosphomannose isomerase [Candidatus Collierbacteria bacterium GW2011_GWC2_43_12]KKT83798.1 MAG: Bifunctional phosphoglucose/phosphomannose isomerase [Microgenomates group bacterium GW2011_GWC1_44_9]